MPAGVVRFAVSVFSDHLAVVEFNLCCLRARRRGGAAHPLRAFGSAAFDMYRRQIESFLVPCGPAETYFWPCMEARRSLHALLRG